MDEMKVKNIEQHVTILGWLYIAISALTLLIGVGVFMLLIFLAPVSGDPQAMRILPVIALFVGGLIFVTAVPGLLAGWGLLKRKSWARLLAVVLGFLNLMNFPLGTILGIYAIWALLQDGASEYFADYQMQHKIA